jgi:hypothetical protein
MANQKDKTNNPLQLSLNTIIQTTLKKNASFMELYSFEQREVLDYIKSNNLDFKIFIAISLLRSCDLSC